MNSSYGGAMRKRISDLFTRISTGRVTLLALIVFILFTALVLPGQAQKSGQDTGEAGSPDLSFFYSPNQLYAMAESYGVDGRQAYIRARFTFDLVWPLVYTFFLVMAISWLNAKVSPSGRLWQVSSLAPVLGAIFDYLENLSTSLVMFRYPSQTPVVDVLAPLFTMVKWSFVAGSFVLLVILIGIGVWRWLSRSREEI
jgi:hypothetical protein